MKKIFALVMSMILVLSLFAGCGSSKTDSDMAYIKDKGKLIVGITDYAPMDYKDENGNWTGFDAEFAQLVAKELGVQVEFFLIADWSKKVFELDSKNYRLHLERHDHQRGTVEHLLRVRPLRHQRPGGCHEG